MITRHPGDASQEGHDIAPAHPPAHPRRPTLKSVAQHAGVSVSTASLVFSGKGPVSDATRRRVREAADELGYCGPDPLASSLRRGRAGIVAVIVEGRLLHAFHDPYAVNVLDGLAGVLDDIPTGMLLVSHPHEHPEQAIERIAGLAIDACVFLGCGATVNPLASHLRSRGIPLVALGSSIDSEVVRIEIDNRGAMRILAQHLRELGHRRVAHVTLPVPGRASTMHTIADLADNPYLDNRERCRAVADVFGADVPAVVAPSADVEGGMIAAATLLDEMQPRPTAILAQSDLLAVGVIRAAQERGLQVPRDLSVTGFDGIALDWWDGVLTTIVQPSVRKGATAGRVVRELLDGGHPASQLLAASLRIGTSSGPAQPSRTAG